MRAAVCRVVRAAGGGPRRGRPVAAVAAGQVRVRVDAAAVNFPDVLLVADEYQISVPTPFVPGSEFAGVVDEVGEGVARFRRRRPGHRHGARRRLRRGGRRVGRRARADPRRRATMHVAAAFGVAHRTAYHVLRSVARLQPGDELVVLGAGGGVGLAAVQLGTVARRIGHRSRIVGGEARGRGGSRARHLVDHRSVDLRQALREVLPDGADVVIDPVGGDLAEPALRALRWGGRFVTVGYASGVDPAHPAQPGAAQGVQILGFQFLDFALHAAPTSISATKPS